MKNKDLLVERLKKLSASNPTEEKSAKIVEALSKVHDCTLDEIITILDGLAKEAHTA